MITSVRSNPIFVFVFVGSLLLLSDREADCLIPLFYAAKTPPANALISLVRFVSRFLLCANDCTACVTMLCCVPYFGAVVVGT